MHSSTRMSSAQQTIHGLNETVLQWARQQFSKEISTDFRVASSFDSVRNRAAVRILRNQPKANLLILADVLPLGVLWDSQESALARSKLPQEERAVVEQLRSALERDYHQHFQEGVEEISSARNPDVKATFNDATKSGNLLQRDILARSGWRAATAARGEWGLIREERGLRTVISLKLRRHLVLWYDVSLSDAVAGTTMRFHDNYLGLLGFGVGEWAVSGEPEFTQIFLRAAEFAFWHVEQYDNVLQTCL
jgi:hypothetical protein